MSAGKSLQETYAPHNACFGCGPSNEKGLRIRSFVQGEQVVATWTPEPYHEAFPGVLNGGIKARNTEPWHNYVRAVRREYAVLKLAHGESGDWTMASR